VSSPALLDACPPDGLIDATLPVVTAPAQ